MKKNTITLSIKVQADKKVTPEMVSQAVMRLINCGIADAQETLKSGEGDLNSAALASSLQVSTPTVASVPRVLVVVSGGVADPTYDEGADVEVFDWDNYNDDPEGTGGVPAHFADLAEACSVPVEKSDVQEKPRAKA